MMRVLWGRKGPVKQYISNKTVNFPPHGTNPKSNVYLFESCEDTRRISFLFNFCHEDTRSNTKKQKKPKESVSICDTVPLFGNSLFFWQEVT